jgi:predicted transcriptional regulator
LSQSDSELKEREVMEMAKAVLISIRPEWVEKIAGGQKTVEVRRTRPKLEPPFKCYIYCTKDKKDSDRLWVLREQVRKEYNGLTAVCAHLRAQPDLHSVGNGHVVGEFVCDSIVTYNYDYCPHPEIGMDYNCGDSWWEIADEDLKTACLTEKEFRYYAFGREAMYGWHISDLKIYAQPKPLSAFKGLRKTKFGYAPVEIKRPPQSWCYVEELK